MNPNCLYHALRYIAVLLIFPSVATSAPWKAIGLTDDRSTDWSLAGRESKLPVDYQIVNFLEHGGTPDNQTDNAPILQSLIDQVGPGTTLYLPPGTYLFRAPISINRDSITLLGSGPEQTRLRFELPAKGPSALILIEGSYTSTPIPLSYAPRQGDSSVTFPPGFKLQKGHDLIISQQNNPEAMGTYRNGAELQQRHLESLETWAARSVGQSLAVESVIDGSAKLKYPLTSDYDWGDVRIQAVEFRQDVGLTNLTIENSRELDGLHSIAMFRAANCWVSSVRSLKTVRSHLSIRYSRNIEVQHSEFYDSFRHGGGGHGYGVVCSKHTNHCLVENNVFSRLRHSMMVKEGANANVFGYNYSYNGYQEGAAVAKDISVHGHYPFKNLFEGNHVEYIHASDYWGAVGPGNTFFRNYISKAALHLEDYSPKQNAIGNDLQAISNWLYNKKSTRFENGIAIGQEVIAPLALRNRTQDNASNPADLPSSLYLDAPPTFWIRSLPWPPFGENTPFGKNKIPAQLAHVRD